MTDPDILSELTTIFRSVLTNDDIVLRPELTTADIPKWDSFRYIDIILRIEETMHVKIRSREANKVRNIGEMVDLIRSKQATA